MSDDQGDEFFVESRVCEKQFADHARALGIIAGNWAVLESEIEMLFGFVFNLDYVRSKIIFHAISTLNVRTNLISSIIYENYQDTPIEQGWNKIKKDIEAASKGRNDTMHSVWAVDPKTGELQRRQRKTKAKHMYIRQNYSADDLMKIAEMIGKTAGAINNLSTQVHNLMKE